MQTQFGNYISVRDNYEHTIGNWLLSLILPLSYIKPHAIFVSYSANKRNV